MKPKKKRSLLLKKKTVANLSSVKLNSVKGGVTTLCYTAQTCTTQCQTMACPETMKCPFSDGLCGTYYCI